MKKLLFFFLLILFLKVFAGSSYAFMEPVYDRIAGETIKGLQPILNAPLKIGKTGGFIINKVVFYDVRIGPDVNADRIEVYYNLARLPFVKGDFLKAITKIVLHGASIKVVKNADNEINLVKLIKLEDGGDQKPGDVPLDAMILLDKCRVDYLDEADGFSVPVEDINGSLDLGRTPRYILALEGTAGLSHLSIKGSGDLKKQSYRLDIQATKLPAKIWGNYILPFLKFESGLVDLGLFIDNDKINLRVDGVANDMPLKVAGRVWPALDLIVDIERADLSEIQRQFPALKVIDVSGRGGARLTIKGPYSKIALAADINISEGSLMRQPFKGKAGLDFAGGRLNISRSKMEIFKGIVEANGSIDFGNHGSPLLNVQGKLSNVDLAAISGNSPGVEGRGSGNVKIDGSLSKFKGEADLFFMSANLLGQPVDRGRASFAYDQGGLEISDLLLSYGQTGLQASGSISSDRRCVLSSRANGITLRGQGFAGEMETRIDDFNGDLAFSINDEFLRSPLKNLFASGNFKLSSSRIGQQRIDSAYGSILIDKGEINIRDVNVIAGESRLVVSGATGIGATDLKISGRHMRFEDLKILNQVLPPAAQDPEGSLDLALSVNGEISSDDPLNSFESFLRLNVEGSLAATTADIADVEIENASTSIVWKNRDLTLADIIFKSEGSNIKGGFILLNNGQLDCFASGQIDLWDMRPLFSSTGNVQGKGNIDLNISGFKDDPKIVTAFDLERFMFNDVHIDAVKGNLTYQDGELAFSPLLIDQVKDSYSLSGNVQFAKDVAKSDVNLKLEIKKGNLKTAANLVLAVGSEVGQRTQPVEAARVFNGQPVLLDIFGYFYGHRPVNLYYTNGKEGGLLKIYGEDVEEVRKLKQASVPQIVEDSGGELSGSAVIRGKLGDLKGNILLKVSQGYYKKYKFDSLNAGGRLESGQLIFDNLELRKSRGYISASGNIDLSGDNHINLIARGMPVDILEVLFENKRYSGSFDLDGKILGSLKSPRAEISFKTGPVSIAGVDYSGIDAKTVFDGKKIGIEGLNIYNGKEISTLKGAIASDFSTINLRASLEGQSLGLVNLLTDEIFWKEGKVRGLINIEKEGELKVRGYLKVKDGKVFVKQIKTDVEQITVLADANGEQVNVTQIAGLWYNNDARSIYNIFSIGGIYDLPAQSVFFALRDTDLDLNIPQMYSGDLKLRSFTLSGQTSNLVLRGEVTASDGSFFLPRGGEGSSGGKPKDSPLSLDLTINLGKSMYLEAGNIGTIDLTNLFIDLEMLGSGLRLTGKANRPDMAGKVFMEKGSIKIFDREFVLLSSDDQKKYYQYEGIETNFAQFGGRGLFPALNLIGVVQVAAPASLKEANVKDVNVVVRVRGIPFAPKEEAVNLKFDAFYLNPATRQMESLSMSDDEIKYLLLPDFVKSLAGANDKQVDPNIVVADYVNSQLQTMVFRQLERKLEKALGLESLTLRYNFGSDLQKAIAGYEAEGVSQPRLTVGFVKGFFDKLYIGVRYSEGFPEAAGEPRAEITSFNYEISYKLDPVWSVVYFREPVPVAGEEIGNYKLTLQAGFSFR
ncbi:MAG: translocation/assembly module TamB domain-containing protein [Candidatus Margulisiibacteriota bacterium]